VAAGAASVRDAIDAISRVSHCEGRLGGDEPRRFGTPHQPSTAFRAFWAVATDVELKVWLATGVFSAPRDAL
jgi:hypothetical protein